MCSSNNRQCWLCKEGHLESFLYSYLVVFWRPFGMRSAFQEFYHLLFIRLARIWQMQLNSEVETWFLVLLTAFYIELIEVRAKVRMKLFMKHWLCWSLEWRDSLEDKTHWTWITSSSVRENFNCLAASSSSEVKLLDSRIVL